MLVGVAGRAQHGKDSIAGRLCDRWGYTRLGFADALKDLALRVNPIVDAPYGGTRLSELVERRGWEGAKEWREVRRFLQELGTQARNIIGEDVWVRALEHAMVQEHTPVVIADVRFPNEADFVHRHGGVLIRVTRLQLESRQLESGEWTFEFENNVDPTVESERHVPTLLADFDIINDGTLDDLYAKVDVVMGQALEGFWGRTL